MRGADPVSRAGAPATVASRDGTTVELALRAPVRAITPGQSGVLYAAGERVLGGGVIT